MNKILLLLIIGFLGVIDSQAGQWLQKLDFGGLARHRPTGVSIGNRGYMGLGHFNGTGIETYFSDWWEYNPANNVWTQKADFIGNNGLGDLGCQAMGLETTGYVGLGELDKLGFYKYDALLNSWSTVSSAPGGNVFQDTDEFIIGNKGYFMDLVNDNIYEYNTDTDTWTQKAPLPVPVWYSYSAFSINGYGYVKANYQLWKYDPTFNSWSYVNEYPGLAGRSSVDFVQHGKAYIVSGYIGNVNADLTDEIWEFDPSTDSWVQFPDFPGTARRYSAGFTIGDYSYLGLGTNGTNFKDFWQFDALNTTELDEKSMAEISIYPNPITEYVMVEMEDKGFSVNVFNQSGKLVLNAVSHSTKLKINRDGLPSGIYSFQIEAHSGGNSQTKQVVFQ